MAEDLKVLLLHGNLDIFIKDAKNLPNMDMFDTTVKTMFWRKGNKTSDPYVSIVLAGAVVGRTFVIPDDENPSWMQHFNVPVAHYAKELHFLVKDDDVLGSEIIGTVSIPVEHLCMGSKLEDTFPVLNSSGKPCKRGAVLTLSIQYFPMERMTIYPRGVGSDPEHSGVPGTYFPLRKCCKVTLYQDAHVHDSLLPNLELDGGLQYKHRSCWSDIFEAISQAQRLVYLVGWSIYHNLRLVREGKAGGAILGDLLKAKSQEGVRVLLLIWDDPTSTSIFGYKSEGVMQTNDEETRRFFKHSSVQVLLCPRASKKGSFMKNQEAGKIYTHHQKTVIVDADAGTGDHRRHIVAFIGGLDLCTGRYDTQEHSLFGTLQTVNKDDYHNPNFVDIAEGGPREPWHDLHSRIDGPAAYDILTNFQERWVKAAKAGIQRLKSAFEDTLVRIERIPAIIGIAEFSSIRKDKDDSESWNVQIFRSIDSNSVKGFPKQPKDASSRNLVCGKNVLIDTGIHTAYIKAIRSAQHFIYIENQYFLGSSYNWDAHQDLGADNLIPVEIALKIASKIRSNERFVAYILIPMWPEGIPTSMTTQRILYWQNKTMQMMYDTIYKAMVEAGVENTYKPQDFLMFFCLGNREAVSEGEDASNSKAANAPQASSQKNRRFMIYVHSKGMIADDEYVILGSANINQRSMEGTRDTEIAMGAYQIGHTWARKDGHPCGQVYGYRMSLWAEHLGGVEECFKHPQSLECARRVKLLSELNWEQYVADQVTDMKGHFMKYPVQVDDTGKVSSLPGYDKFPDLGGLIVGTFSVIQENLTI